MTTKTDSMADQDELYMVYTHVSDTYTGMQAFTGSDALERANEHQAKQQETYVYVRLVQYLRVAEL